MTTTANISQFIRFSLVGMLNTLITLLTIWVFLNVFSASQYTANVVGYVLGVVNSYVFNKLWTFNNRSKVSVTFIKFIFVFGISYLIQLGALALLLNFTSLKPFISQIISMVVYTIINFALNKFITFKN